MIHRTVAEFSAQNLAVLQSWSPPSAGKVLIIKYLCGLMFMYYIVCYFTDIVYGVVRQISMLFRDNKDSV